jgi:diaminopimelate epimerase
VTQACGSACVAAAYVLNSKQNANHNKNSPIVRNFAMPGGNLDIRIIKTAEQETNGAEPQCQEEAIMGGEAQHVACIQLRA